MATAGPLSPALAAGEEGPSRGVLHSELVRVCGLGSVEARDSRLELLGATVQADGKYGWAYWCAERGVYVVQTFDALLLEVSEDHVEVCENLEPEDGGFDLIWPALPAASETFAVMIAENLQAKGFCFIQMSETDMLRKSLLQIAVQNGEYVLPPFEFEEAYLGKNHSSKVWWLGGMVPDDDLHQDALVRSSQYLVALARVLLPVVGSYLGFSPHDYLSGTLLRLPLTHQDEREELSPGFINSDDVEAGVVERHLDFMQRRRLCVMYLVDNDGGTLELYLREDLGERTVRIPISKDRLLIFRCDVLGYSYRSKCSNKDVVLQTWIMEEPPALKIDSFVGDQKGMEAIVGGPHLPVDKQVHVMAAHCRFPGCGYGGECAHLTWTMQVDSFLEIPLGRFDMSLYYTHESEQFAIGGRSVTKHIGALGDNEWINFDNEYFGMETELANIIPPCQRVCLEMSVETLHMVGYRSKESLRGNRHMMVVVADIGLDWDGVVGLTPGPYHNPEMWLKAGTWGNSITSSNRLHYLLGLEGPAHQIDTACSASMVGTCMGHAQLRKTEKGATEALVQGFQSVLTPWPFIGLSGAGMVGRAGRSLFFDQSANGFARGEGWGGLFLRAGDSVQAVQERLCVCASSYINQDGRSASLTAPNGPSQQAVIRGSLANVNIHPDDVACTENHGTGTALGDPIEASSVKAVFGRKRASGPIPVTSGKSHMGHLEPGAGTVGIIKTITSLVHAAVPANVHLRELNAHIEDAGFPGLFPTERTDLATEYHYGGANGFGFGGTNSRVDLWARRLHRVRDGSSQPRELIGMPRLQRNVVPEVLSKQMQKLQGITLTCARCQGPMCWLCGAVPSKGLNKHRCSAVREEFAQYDCCSNCYEGGYKLGSGLAADEDGTEPPSLPHIQKFYLVGTWTAWSTWEVMTPGIGTADVDVYEAEITLGETRVEQFYVAMERYGTRSFFHPVVGKAGQSARIVGPEEERPGADKCWQIDGRQHGMPAGTVYQVSFAWGGAQKWIMWQPTEKRRSVQEIWSEDYRHTYSIVSSLNEWRPLDMRQHPHLLELWEAVGRIPARGEAEFVVQRDHDVRQTLYPLTARPRDTSVPVIGPDDSGSGKRWLVWGEPGEIVIFRLCITDRGDFSVQVISRTMGELTWQSPLGRAGVVYDLVGSFSDWKFSGASELQPDPSSPNIRRCQFKMGVKCKEEFQIVVNQNWGRRLYPEIAGDPTGACIACGPDGKAHDRNWEVVGYPGQKFEVILNLGAEDKRRLVTCMPLLDDNWADVDDGRTEWTDEEWATWEAQWSAYGEQWASGLYAGALWPPGGSWPGAEGRPLPPGPGPGPARRADPLADGLNPWTEERIEE